MAKEVTDSIKPVLDGKEPWPLVLIGEAGSGKTCTALLIVDTFGGRYHTAGEWCQIVADAMMGRLRYSSGYVRTLGEVWQEWSKAGVAVLDELGARGNVTDHHYDTVKRCIDTREGKPAVFISNYSIGELCRFYDDRIASRLAGGTVVMMSGDRRVRGKWEQGVSAPQTDSNGLSQDA